MATPTSKRTTAPAFQFYPKDFLSSSKVMRMTATERGIYITLLCVCWLEGGLPDDVSELSKLARVPLKQFSRIWPHNLQQCFTLVKGGKLVNDRLDRERQKQADFRRRQTDNGRLGGRKPNPSLTQPLATLANPSLSSPISDLRSASASTTKRERELADEPFSAVGADDGQPDGQKLFAELVAAYPAERVTHSSETVHQFLHELGPSPAEWESRFALMRATLVLHKASEQWSNPRFAPNLITWLKRGDWRGTRKLALASTGTEGRGRTGAPPKDKYAGIEEGD